MKQPKPRKPTISTSFNFNVQLWTQLTELSVALNRPKIALVTELVSDLYSKVFKGDKHKLVD